MAKTNKTQQRILDYLASRPGEDVMVYQLACHLKCTRATIVKNGKALEADNQVIVTSARWERWSARTALRLATAEDRTLADQYESMSAEAERIEALVEDDGLFDVDLIPSLNDNVYRMTVRLEDIGPKQAERILLAIKEVYSPAG
jgi:DNA-binding MarR family transcriptional regulator